MKKDSPEKKRPYSPPLARKLTLEEAKRFVAEHANWSDQAMTLLDSLRQEQQQMGK